ncbi:MAG TPA: DUF502 domain-containing protein [bacterium]|nr:DUF502 domain-containing protein [bacterium]HOL46594.1 DUF502 domain-containing protein [bacterium]HPQ17835.1 DUF502 domain-containing protein [bacterium]
MKTIKKNSSNFKKKFQSYFLTGFISIFPFLATIYIIKIIFLFIKNNFPIEVLSKIHPIINYPIIFPIFTLILATVFSILFLTLFGFFISNFIGKKIFLFLEKFLFKVPIINKIYNWLKQLILSFSLTNKDLLKKVVLVEFPKKGTFTIGFITSIVDKKIFKNLQNDNLNYYFIYVPTTPNPTSGYLLIFNENEITELNISTEEAIKLVISLGFYHFKNE